MNKIWIGAITSTLLAATLVVTLGLQSASAQLVKGPGASGLTPGQEAKAPSFPLPPLSAKDFAPGQEGLLDGIIGPGLKK